ncbi:MAG: twin-arginine translocase TatA/TatE family subunit [Alphaproteobacteria bacterium]|nr:twin-arginine translocase TatA/TatE family subunit [Alphaproteobacteria bacterium]
MNVGIWQIVLILVIVLLLFGAGKLPRIMGDFAKGIKSFKSGMKDGAEPPASTTQPRVSEQQTAADNTTSRKDETVQQ